MNVSPQPAPRLAWFHGPGGPIASVPIAAGPQPTWEQAHAAARWPHSASTLAVTVAAPGSAGTPPWRTLQPAVALGRALAIGERRALPALPAAPVCGGAPAAAAAPPAGGLASVPWSRSVVRPLSAVAARAVAAHPPDFAQPANPRAPVRVHVEEGRIGVTVYLGVDVHAGSPALSPAALATQLRRQLATSGLRLAALVCNGAVLEPAPYFHQEP